MSGKQYPDGVDKRHSMDMNGQNGTSSPKKSITRQSSKAKESIALEKVGFLYISLSQNGKLTSKCNACLFTLKV